MKTTDHSAEQGKKTWYALSSQEVLERLRTREQGLSGEEARNRLERHGRNKLQTRKAPSLLTVIFRQLKSPLIYVLLIAGILSIIIGNLSDAAFIFFVVLLNTVIGTIQEYKAEKSAEELQKMIESSIQVKRDGQKRRIEAELVVPGDIVLLESGVRVAADARILKSHNLGIDESILTGESTTVEKDASVIDAENPPIGERINMLFAGTSVITGRAEAIVVATARDTELGKISEAVTETETEQLPLVKRMDRFLKNLSIVILGAVILLGIVAFVRGMPLLEVFFMAVALAVSAIPAGLPVAMTVALAIGVNRMARRKAIVRKLPAVEGLGSCTYIASDKTGTLTANIQTARRLVLLSGSEYRLLTVSGQGYTGEGELHTDTGESPEKHERDLARSLSRIAVICNEGTLTRDDGFWQHDGDPIDVALLALGYKAGLDPAALREEISVTAQIPFESERKYAAVFFSDSEGSRRTAVKGAAETILPFCTTIPGGDKIDPDLINDMEARLTGEGYRVLAIAGGDGGEPADPENPSEKDLPALTFLGLVGFIDPLRPEVKEAVASCRSAGIRVSMITGDHPRTALAIARDLGIAESEEHLTTGTQLRKLRDDNPREFDRTVQRSTVFARINPLQKVSIVDSLVKSGAFVAVTGDGVNDAPALRKANLGIAMGSGNDVAKDTGSIIITDDNFASIVAGVEEGRRAYQNLRKVIYVLISTGVAEVILFTLATIFGMPLPLLAIQLLWLNFVTNGIQDVALAFERGEREVMNRPPRDPGERIFNARMIQETLLTGVVMAAVAFGLWIWELSQAGEVVPSRNLVLLLMVFYENYHAFNCRSESQSVFRIPLRNNPFLVISIFVALAIHISSLYIPFMQDLLNIQPVSLQELVFIFLLASSVLIASELFKLFVRRSEARNHPGAIS